jgi:hypothetical protein
MNANTNIMRTTKPAGPRDRKRKLGQAALKPREDCRTIGGRRIRKATADGSQSAQVEPSAEQFTVVEARIDVGLGNALFIRGQGDGLNWDQGQPLACMNASTWIWHSTQAREKIVFKLLLKDQVWAKGPDMVLEAGRKLEVVPAF